MNAFLNRLGPGIIFTAMAVGVSHIVQSTRAGAEYGFTILIFLVLANIIKYPLFRFATTYSAATGKTLLDGYRAIGRPATLLLTITVIIDMFIAAAAVTLVTAGIVKSVLGLNLPILPIVAMLGGVVFVIIASSSYHLFERATLTIVTVLSVLTIFAAAYVLPSAFVAGPGMFPKISLTSPEVLIFLIAMAGWMPNPPSAAFFLSAWTALRAQKTKKTTGNFDTSSAIMDINLGYALSLVIALCFAVMGAVILFLPGTALNVNSASGFASGFIGLFSTTFGGWIKPIIGSAAILAMLSTMMALFDGAPRMMRQVIGVDENNRLIFCLMFAVQLFGVMIIIWAFSSSFKTFIDFITGFSFLTAPFIAYFNHRLMFGEDIPKVQQPGKILKYWSWIGIVSMALFGLIFFAIKFT